MGRSLLSVIELLLCDLRDLYGLPPNALVLGFEVEQTELYYVPQDVMKCLMQNGAMNTRHHKGLATSIFLD